MAVVSVVRRTGGHPKMNTQIVNLQDRAPAFFLFEGVTALFLHRILGVYSFQNILACSMRSISHE